MSDPTKESGIERTPAMPVEGAVPAFDAGWQAHESGLGRDTVETLTPVSGRGWALMGWDCRAEVERQGKCPS